LILKVPTGALPESAGRICDVFNGCQNVLVRRASTEVAGEPFPNLSFYQGATTQKWCAHVARGTRHARVRLREHTYGRHNLAWRTVPTLERVVLCEGRLQGVKRSIRTGQPLYRDDLTASTRKHQSQARQNTSPINEDGAGTTCAMIAALLGAREAQALPQCVEQGHPRLNCHLTRGPVHVQ
jgi:hypothetical protein